MSTEADTDPNVVAIRDAIAKKKTGAGTKPSPIPQYRVEGPTRATHNLLIMDGDRCLATVKYDPHHDAECRKIACRMSRAEARTFVLKHLLAELEGDEGRWGDECAMIRAELTETGDQVDA